MSTRTPLRLAAATAVAVAIGLGATACGSDEAAGIAIDDPWARTSAMSQTMGAAYMTITGGDEDDRLVSASVSSDVAADVQLHETVTTGSDEMSGMEGEMTMREVEAIDVPAGETVTLEPGGLHVMLIDLVEPLEEGSTFDLTLEFESAGEQVVEVTVRDA
jgi:hypothetical protein